MIYHIINKHNFDLQIAINQKLINILINTPRIQMKKIFLIKNCWKKLSFQRIHSYD
jgi:hypothetical protein